MAENQIKIEISAGIEELTKALKEGDKAAVKFSGNLTASFAPIRTAAEKTSSSIKDGFSSAFSSMAKGVAVGNLVSTGIIGAFSAVKDFLVGSIHAAAEQEVAINKLGQALRAAGSYSKEAVDEFIVFSGELQKASTYTDDVILGQVAMAKSFGATNAQAKQLVTAAANLAATFGGSLDERVGQLGQTLTGTAGKLGTLIPGFKNLTEEQLKSGAAADFVNSKFGGASQSELDTYSGKITAMKNAMSQFQEELGAVVTQNSFVSDSIQVATGLFEELSVAMADSHTQAARQKEGFVETSSSVDQLSRQYNKLKVDLIDYEQVVLRNKDKGFLDSIFTTDNVPLAKERIQALTFQLKGLKEQLDKAKSDLATTKGNTPTEVVPVIPQTPEQKDKAAKLLADNAAVEQQLLQQRADFEAFRAQLELDKGTLTEEQRVIEYDNLLAAEQAKIEAVREAELAKAQLIKDAGLKKATIDQVNNKADLARSQTFLTQKDKQDKEGLALSRATQQAYLSASSNFIQAGLVLAKEGSIAQKALQITQATISSYVAGAQAFADPSIPAAAKPFVMASIIALGLANVAKIAGAKFANGGIAGAPGVVGGNSFSGDKIPSLINSGEMILNKNQQTELFRQANGAGGNGGNMADMMAKIVSEIRSAPIIVEANGREIARLIRDEHKNGFEVFA